MFWWLDPIGRRCSKASSGSRQLTAFQPSIRALWQSIPSHITSRTKPPIWSKHLTRMNFDAPIDISSEMFSLTL